LSEPAKKNDNKGLVGSYATGYSLGIKFIVILICPIASGLACGLWLDEQLETTPWLTLVLLIMSLALAIYAVFRVAANLQDELN